MNGRQRRWGQHGLEPSSLALLPSSCSVNVFIHLRTHLPRDGAAHYRQGPALSIISQNSVPQICLLPNPIKAILSPVAPSSQVTLDWIKLTIKTKIKHIHHNPQQQRFPLRIPKCLLYFRPWAKCSTSTHFLLTATLRSGSHGHPSLACTWEHSDLNWN